MLYFYQIVVQLRNSYNIQIVKVEKLKVVKKSSKIFAFRAIRQI